MAASKHPLDLFRASKSGFESATRDERDPRTPRRRVSGKVLLSTPREDRGPVAPAQGDDEADAEAPEHDLPAAASVDEAPLDEPHAEAAADEPADAAAQDTDDDTDEPSEEGPTNALEAILAQRRALGVSPSASPEGSKVPAADEPPSGEKPRRRVKVPPKPLEPVGLEAGRGPASVSRPLNQVARSDDLGLPPGVSSRTRTLSYKLLGAAGALVIALVLWSLFTDGDDADTPALSRAALANAGTDQPLGEAATPSEFTIQAASYGSNLDAAQAAADALEARGFRDVEIIGVPDGDGGFAKVTLLVGRADSKAELAAVFQRLRETPLGDEQRPFYDSYIVGHPAAE